MTSAFGIAAAFLTILGAGAGVTALLGQRRTRGTELFALSWLLGTAFVSLALWMFGLALGGPLLHAAVASCCVILAFVAVRKHSSIAPTREPERVSLILWLLIAVECAFVFYGSLQHTLGWDGLLIWELKARYAFDNGGALPLAYFTDETRRFSHPEYPLALPLTQAWLYLWLGEPHQLWAKLIPPTFYVAGMIMLANGAAELSGRRSVGLLLAAVYLFIPAVNSAPGSILVGYADLPLGFFFLAGVRYLLRYCRDGDRVDAFTFCALAAVLPWMKRDGMILWAVVATVGAFVIHRRANWRWALLSFAPGLVIIGAWSLFLSRMHAAAPADFQQITAATLARNAERAGPIVVALGRELVAVERWSIFWPGVALALVCAAFRRAGSLTAIVALLVCAPIALYCATYVFSSWPEYLGHVQASLPRLLLQTTPVAMLAFALALREPHTTSKRTADARERDVLDRDA